MQGGGKDWIEVVLMPEHSLGFLAVVPALSPAAILLAVVQLF